MRLLINGEPREIDGAKNVTDLVAALDLPAPTLLVEHNSMALRREEWPARELSDGDRIEIISIVAGG